MVSLIAALDPFSLTHSKFSLPTSSHNPQAVRRRGSPQVFLGCCYSARVVVLRCKRFESAEGDQTLEAEVLEFMKKSANPDQFPSRKDLIQGGRKDLADVILRRGGWMTMGWDLDEDNQEKERGEDLNAAIEKWESSYPGKGEDESEQGLGSSKVANEQENTESFSSSSNSRTLALSSGRSAESAVEEEAGVHGILNRLEKQRDLSFALHTVKNDKSDFRSSNAKMGPQNMPLDNDSAASFPVENGQPRVSPSKAMRSKTMKGIDPCKSSIVDGDLKPDSWRTWSYQRAGHSDKIFEAAEIEYDQSRNETLPDPSMSGIVAFSRDDAKEVYAQGKNLNIDQLKSRLKHLELELSCALRLMKSNSDDLSEKVDSKHLPDDVRDLSDACEFQENEIMKSQDKLRSLRAKLAVLEGKMSMTISDAHKVVEEKQKRIEHNRKALLLLRPTCIVWANSGSEVLLAGSFDGWATKRKMEKSNTGIFSICLKLYPGIYEIKFIVDGKWMVDPLRPIADNSGYRNNLLFVSER